MLKQLQAWARRLKKQLFVLYYAYRDARTPGYAKLLSACVVAYAFSPIDLIPDFVPILGYLDDLILVPLGVKLALRMTPPSVLDQARARAEARMASDKPKNWVAATIIVMVWAAVVLSVCLIIF